MATSGTESTGVKSDETLLTIVDALKDFDSAGITEIADEIGVAKSTVHKHLKSLEAHDMVTNENGRYSLGFKFLMYGGYARDTNRLCRLGKSIAEDLAQRTGGAITFAVEEHGMGVFAVSRGGDYNRNPLGTRFYLNQNSVGKSMLSEMTDDEIDAVIDRHGLPGSTDNTITDRDELFENVERIRERGYALSMGERTEAIRAVGVPVYDPESETLGAMSIAVPRHRVTREELETEYAKQVLEAVDQLKLGVRYD